MFGGLFFLTEYKVVKICNFEIIFEKVPSKEKIIEKETSQIGKC